MSQSSSWNWLKVREQIRSLAGRQGFPEGEHLDFLMLRIDLRSGKMFDLLKKREFDVADHRRSLLIKAAYYVLEGYSRVEEVKSTGRLITHKYLRGARFGDFSRLGYRDKLLTLFMKDQAKFRDASLILGGLETEFPYGDYSFEIHALPLVPLTFVLSVGDDEFPSDARIFYDENIETYLDVERINFLSELTINRLEDAAEVNTAVK